MGTTVEYNTVLALREYNHPDYSEIQAVPGPHDLVLGRQFSFNKVGYRIFELNKPIPLVVTKGGQDFDRVLGLVEIQNLTIEPVAFLDKDLSQTTHQIETSGEYVIVTLFSEKEAAQWLKMLLGLKKL